MASFDFVTSIISKLRGFAASTGSFFNSFEGGATTHVDQKTSPGSTPMSTPSVCLNSMPYQSVVQPTRFGAGSIVPAPTPASFANRQAGSIAPKGNGHIQQGQIGGIGYVPPVNQGICQSPLQKPVAAPQGGWMDAVESSSSSCGDEIDVYDDAGKALRLGARDERGAGGEGTVYELPMNRKFLVKIYKENTLGNASKMHDIRKRISDMVRIRECSNMPSLAWPQMPVFNARKEVIGFVMRKCTGVSLLRLRGTKSISSCFPKWTRRDLALTARDFIRKVQLLAGYNVLVNDFNPANFLVNEKHEVSFIDCDSFQVPSFDGGVNITNTYFSSHVAPELLLDKKLLARPRTIEQVEFGAAIIVFNILMCGMHPYSYCTFGKGGNCGTPEDNLKNGRCPLGKGADCRLPHGGWYNLWSWLPYKMKGLFIKMFKDGHANPSLRPSLNEIEDGLRGFIYEMEHEPRRIMLEPNEPQPKQKSSQLDF